MQKAQEKVAHLREAIRRIHDGASVRSISREFGIPRTTLHDKLYGLPPVDSVTRTELRPEEENGLVTWIVGMAERGFGRDRPQILAQVKKILDSQHRQSHFKDNLPGKDWYYGFLKHHPQLTNRTPMQLSKQRALVAPGMVQNWFTEMKAFLDTDVNDPTLWEEPERWFNADETGFPLCPKSGKVVCHKGSSNIYNFTTCDKSVITVMACLSASGGYVQPMIVFSGTRFSYSPLEGFEDAAFGRSHNGWMDTELFFTWLKNVFISHLDTNNIKRPVVLLVDGHRTHLSMEASNICLENGIVLYCLLANASHVIQPCDLRLFSSLKYSWRRAVLDFQDKNPGEVVTKYIFARVLKPAWEQAAKPELAIAGFRDAGIFPYDPAKVVDSPKLKPSQLFAASTTGSVQIESLTPAPTLAQSSPASSVPVPSAFPHPLPLPPIVLASQSSQLIHALDRISSRRPKTLKCHCGQCQCPCAPLTSTQIPSHPTPSIPSTSTQAGPSTPSTSSSTPAGPSSPSSSSSTPAVPPISFASIPFPQVPPPKTSRAKKQHDTIPKAATGAKFREMLLERKRKKEEEQREKEERKRLREEKKRKTMEEKERKKEERERVKRQKLALIREMEEEMEKSEDDLATVDINSCAKCGEIFQPSECANWIGCNKCPRWMHKRCTGQDFSQMTDSDIEGFYFECIYC